MKVQRENEFNSLILFAFGTGFLLMTLFVFNLVSLTLGVILMSLGAYRAYKGNEAARQLRIHQFSGMVKAESVYKLMSLH